LEGKLEGKDHMEPKRRLEDYNKKGKVVPVLN
jgi:hypothetical protein